MVMSPAVSAIALISVLFWSEAFAQAKTYWYCQFTPGTGERARTRGHRWPLVRRG
jgi:hypothetical protein